MKKDSQNYSQISRSDVIEQLDALADSGTILEELYRFLPLATLEEFAEHMQEAFNMGASLRVAASDLKKD